MRRVVERQMQCKTCFAKGNFKLMWISQWTPGHACDCHPPRPPTPCKVLWLSVRLTWLFGVTIVMDFFLNDFNEFSEFSDKNICYDSKRGRTCHLLCKRPDATTAAENNMWKTESLSPTHASVISQIHWIRWIHWILMKVLLHLGKELQYFSHVFAPLQMSSLIW